MRLVEIYHVLYFCLSGLTVNTESPDLKFCGIMKMFLQRKICEKYRTVEVNQSEWLFPIASLFSGEIWTVGRLE